MAASSEESEIYFSRVLIKFAVIFAYQINSPLCFRFTLLYLLSNHTIVSYKQQELEIFFFLIKFQKKWKKCEEENFSHFPLKSHLTHCAINEWTHQVHMKIIQNDRGILNLSPACGELGLSPKNI